LIEEKKYEKWGSDVNKIHEISGMSKQDAVFLVGRLAVEKNSISHITRCRFLPSLSILNRFRYPSGKRSMERNKVKRLKKHSSF